MYEKLIDINIHVCTKLHSSTVFSTRLIYMGRSKSAYTVFALKKKGGGVGKVGHFYHLFLGIIAISIRKKYYLMDKMLFYTLLKTY